MAKAENKGQAPEGIKIKDLSVDKRIELFNEVFGKFKEEMAEVYGLAFDMELVYSPKATVPRLVLVDLLNKKEDGQKQGKAPLKPKA